MLESLLRPTNPYANPEEKHHALIFGMWLFLGTEILLFGGLFLGLSAYRVLYPAEFALGSHHMALWMGTANTFVLLTSSLSMALAVRAAQNDSAKLTALLLLVTAGLGAVFLGIKFTEYADHIQHGLWPGPGFHVEGTSAPERVRLFFLLYFIMTGLHALHLTIGIGLVSLMALLAWRKAFIPAAYTPVEMTGLYWHLVDIVWIFLFPMFYLIGHH